MSDETKPWIKAKMLIEVAGFPQEHVDHAMKLITEKFAADRTDVRNISKKTNAAKKVESPDVKEFYTGFLEIDAEYEDIIALLHLTLEFLPSHVEIIAPENIQLATTNLTELFTDISGRIHQYESMVRSLKADQEIMEREYNKLIPEEKKKEVIISIRTRELMKEGKLADEAKRLAAEEVSKLEKQTT
ncbi:TPA: hypothetical protein H1009_00280 [archaeon]|nr:hypothetical protein [Candidatus Naiadarchaeales archaeon SRR2090153.bin461]